MSILSQLQNNKGTISSTLGKMLAIEVLSGDSAILNEAIDLTTFKAADKKEKNVRAGAAKIVQVVAENRPELVAPYLEKLLPALLVAEPQTRWMIIRTMGFCAHLNKKVALKSIEYAQKYLDNKEGICLSSSAELCLGDIGALSPKDAAAVFPILENASRNAEINEVDWILEAYLKMSKNLGEAERNKVIHFANSNRNDPKKSTHSRVKKLLKQLK